jgi:hypothetical protein
MNQKQGNISKTVEVKMVRIDILFIGSHITSEFTDVLIEETILFTQDKRTANLTVRIEKNVKNKRCVS